MNKIYVLLISIFLGCIFSSYSLASSSVTEQDVRYVIKGTAKKAINENITARLGLLRKRFPKQLDQADIDKLNAKALTEIVLAIAPFGYFNPTVKLLQQTHNRSYWTLRYLIHLGQPTLITKINIQLTGPGKTNHALLQVASNPPLIEHHALTTEDYEHTQSLLFNTAYHQGYLQAKLSRHQVRINRRKHEAEVDIIVDTGKQFYYGPVHFGDTPYNKDFLHRFVNFNVGDVYSPEKLQELQTDLINTKYFSNVSIQPKITQDDQSVPIQINTDPVKSQQYKLGIGYGTNTGPRTSIGLDFHRVTDTGQHFTTLLNLSRVATGLTTKYFFPGPQPAINEYTIGGYIGTFKPDAGTAFPRRISVGYNTAWPSAWHFSGDLNYLTERFQLDNDPYTSADLIYPSVYLSFMKSDNPINPTKGISFSSMNSFSVPGNEIEFFQTELTGKWIYPPSQNNFIILRGNLGATNARNYEERFPLSKRFFAGGINSIRGYTYQSIGPGKYLKIWSAEFQQRLVGDFFGGIFIDEGTASNHSNESLQRGIGIALVYRTSVGPINFNIAQANTDPRKPIRFEFSFGANL